MPEIPFLVLKIMALIVVAIATVCDLKSRKIPNKLTFPASGIGIIMQSIYFASWGTSRDLLLQTSAGFLCAVFGWFVGVIVMSIYKLFLRQFGHGDTKLVGAVGTFVGPWYVLLVIFYYMLCFGVFSILRMAWAVPWTELWISAEMKKAGVTPISVGMEKLNIVRKEIIPVAPFIAAGTLCAILFERPTLEFLGFLKE